MGCSPALEKCECLQRSYSRAAPGLTAYSLGLGALIKSELETLIKKNRKIIKSGGRFGASDEARAPRINCTWQQVDADGGHWISDLPFEISDPDESNGNDSESLGFLKTTL